MSAKFVRLFFPNRCVLCESVLAGDAALCETCRGKITLLGTASLCQKCSRPVSSGQAFCRDCLVQAHSFAACYAAALYEGALRQSVLRFKFYRHPEYYRGYAQMILARLVQTEHLPHFDAVIAAPLSAERRKERGYNQSELLAKAVSKGLGVPFEKNCIQKIRHTPAQSTLSYTERMHNLRSAFRIKAKERVRGKTILLVDDILTTGATADEIARVLLRAGAHSVYAAVLAVTPIKEDAF